LEKLFLFPGQGSTKFHFLIYFPWEVGFSGISRMKDVDVFAKNMFRDMVMEKMTGLKY
jgi:hypothetical protein